MTEREGSGSGRCIIVLMGGRSGGHQAAVLAAVSHVVLNQGNYLTCSPGLPSSPPNYCNFWRKQLFYRRSYRLLNAFVDGQARENLVCTSSVQ